MSPYLESSRGTILPSDAKSSSSSSSPPSTLPAIQLPSPASARLLTIDDWRQAALTTSTALPRILSLLGSEAAANPSTRAWVTLATPDQIQAQWSVLESRRHNAASLPLFGVPFAVKDNIDVDGFPTTAACPAFSSAPAPADAPVVSRLKAAGAIVVGKTNMDQFATGLSGTRSPHGAVPNAFDPARISGGSSSGSGLVVARAAVPFALGTDTAGSGRVPAGLNNIVGLKPTRGALSTRGVLPACRTLDCVSIFALTVHDAQAVLDVAQGYDPLDSYSRPCPSPASAPPPGAFALPAFGSRPPSLAICSHPDWFDAGQQQSPVYEAALAKARALGWRLQAVDFSPLFALARLLYDGPWVAERYAAVKSFIDSCRLDEMNPVVRELIAKAKAFTAADAFAAEYQRQDLSRQIALAFRHVDALLVPTAPAFPTIERLQADPVRENSLLGTYTNFVNLLDWSAIAIPAGFRADGLPFGLTLIAGAWQEARLINLAQQWSAAEARPLGATGLSRAADGLAELSSLAQDPEWTPLAVVGAHLTGFPLNKDLVNRGARFVESAQTSARYRLYELNLPSGPRKPGLERVVDGDVGRHPSQISVEVWELPRHAVAGFLATVMPPLALGSIELEDGRWVRGFVCEPYGLDKATDITLFGGWKAYIQSLESHLNCNGLCKMVPSTPASCPRSPRQLSRVLIANRGEIASRIIRTLRKMKLEAVAIYSDPDAAAPHVRDADMSLRLQGTSVTETYLDGAQILKLAASVGADAIIPGYGFLSENPDFARQVESAGIVWIGPTPDQMSSLGLKHRSRDIATGSGVRVVPGSSQLLTSLEDAQEQARHIGFPVMLKSTAGGGGIGLRLCLDPDGLEAAYGAVQRLAAANFGQSGIFLEKYIQNARHIEVQILGDGQGRVIATGERDCSLQRRHQKVIEESPAFAVPSDIRARIRASAVRLAAAVNYRNLGTVEFVYDADSHDYYFLEVNTRLQVEHTVTEAVTGLDLVECMVKIAQHNCHALFEPTAVDDIPVAGASIEVRLYAEDPLRKFCPTSGTITSLSFSPLLRVDSGVELGATVSSRYDPLLAKLIAFGRHRGEALQQLAAGLAETDVGGVQTNLEYLRQIVSWSLFQSGGYRTTSLDTFHFCSPSLEVVSPGAMTTIQDFPGRVGYWRIGVPPSGPMDDLSFRLANRLVKNDDDAAALECTLQGPTLKFHCDSVVAVTGAKFPVAVDDQPMPSHQPFAVRAGQTLTVGSAEDGYRAYVAIAGGLPVPRVMGSRATFELGGLGGKDGAKLQQGDIVPIGSSSLSAADLESLPVASPLHIPPQPNACWTIGVVPGPHGAPDYFQAQGLEVLFAGEWSVHHNSNRLGVRLVGPRPQWARQSGGEAGLHPSNIHDSPYSVGSISFTGDEAVVLTCDGPSLGGFVVFCVVASAEMWKLGQVRPGDKIRLCPIDTAAAIRLDADMERAMESLRDYPEIEAVAALQRSALGVRSVEAGTIDCGGKPIGARQAGDRAIVLEFGIDEVFDMAQSVRIQAFCNHLAEAPVEGIQEVTPGVRTVHIVYARRLSPQEMLARLRQRFASYAVPRTLPSRLIRLPLAFEDSVSQAAIDRYAATIRPDAPWLPSNVRFLEQLNGLDDLSSLLYDATFLVLGLGDVFLGSPCAVPLDPRHRLLGTKYNPSRSFTPRCSVGIGGQYMCIYAADSPGGYQLVGRTIDIWDPQRVPEERPACSAAQHTDGDANHTGSKGGREPWLFRPFDRIAFYRVDESELEARSMSELMSITDGEFNLDEYEAWIKTQSEDIALVASQRREAIARAPFLEDLRRPHVPKIQATARRDGLADSSLSTTCEKVKAMMPGRCYNLAVAEGDHVQKGAKLMCMESSKMEIEIRSPLSGTCTGVRVRDGELVDVGDVLVTIDCKAVGPEETEARPE